MGELFLYHKMLRYFYYSYSFPRNPVSTRSRCVFNYSVEMMRVLRARKRAWIDGGNMWTAIY